MCYETDRQLRILFNRQRILGWIVILCNIALAVLILSVSTCRADKWAPQEITAEVVWEILHVVDWGTTRDIAVNPGTYHETGPMRLFIGQHPSTQSVDIAMGVSAILHPIITHWMPRKAYLLGYEIAPRDVWQYVSIGATGACVVNNLSIGLRVNF